MCPSVPLLEICLLTDDHRVASVKASTTVDLFSLSKEQFQDILEEYPEMKQTMSTVAVERLHKIGMNPPRKLSAHVSELFAEPVDEYQKAHEGMAAEALEGRPLRIRQVSFASEDEVVNLRRWSDCPHFDRQTELQTMPTKSRSCPCCPLEEKELPISWIQLQPTWGVLGKALRDFHLLQLPR